VGGKLYVIGGFSTGMWTPVNATYEYDPVKDSWTEKAHMPTARGAMAATAIDGKIYVVGGAYKSMLRLVNTGANEVYDPAEDRWRRLKPIPTPRDHLAAAVRNGILYAIGGRVDVDYNQNLDINEAYDPKTGEWSQRKPLPTARSGIAAQVLDGKIYVMGGESGQGTFKENEAYDPEKDAWEAKAPLLHSRHGLSSALIGEQIHLLTGGPNPGGGGSSFYEIFSLKP
ncbi:MAG: galactose oxidase, partial [Nitrospinae bacterium]|nr:galactose oxidase [Nitrospinota bacterium]